MSGVEEHAQAPPPPPAPWENVQTMTLNDIVPVDCSSAAPIRVLVTIHSINVDYSNTVKNGLGLWVFYILKKYFRMRNIPVKLYMKSIVVCREGVHKYLDKKTDVEDLVKFIKSKKIDLLIPSDVTDTQFIARNIDKIAPYVKCAVTPDVTIYERLEDKWETYKFCEEYGLPTPLTEKFEGNNVAQTFPFFLKISSGTNGGRGVWFIKNKEDLEDKLRLKECCAPGTILLAQKPTMGQVICAQVVYDHGWPVGFFFAESKSAGDLAGIGKKYIFSKRTKGDSHIKVELKEYQWEAVAKIFCQIGEATKYHGMIDIEFIVAAEGNDGVDVGSVWLLESNPRFSGDIHTALSNPGFLDAYMDVVHGRVDANCPVRNFSRGVEMQSAFKSFNVLPFYLRHFYEVALLRNWNIGLGLDRSGTTIGVRQKQNIRGTLSKNPTDSTVCSANSI